MRWNSIHFVQIGLGGGGGDCLSSEVIFKAIFQSVQHTSVVTVMSALFEGDLCQQQLLSLDKVTLVKKQESKF